MKPIFPILAAAAAAWSLATVPAQASNTFPASGYGQAYSASVILNSSLPSQTLAGPIAPAVLSCNVRTATNTNRVLSVNLGSALISGTGTNTVMSTHSMSGATMQSTATIQAVNALGGLITASAVHAVANSAASAVGASSNGNGSSFLNLIIAGIPVVANPAPNTTVSVPGIGSATLNEQLLYTSASSTTFTVNMIHIRVTVANALGLKIGTNIIVAHATSSLTRMVTSTTVSASAYGLFAKGFAGNINLI
ncbi:MAG: hypothetical protein M3Z14_00175, partial [Candidatus Eremiobacteraeota bacterium]|nr:hypothetical protein [Candidatus Eremiobacteraeota bacterium]